MKRPRPKPRHAVPVLVGVLLVGAVAATLTHDPPEPTLNLDIFDAANGLLLPIQEHEVSWSEVYASAEGNGTHVNLNQPAKRVDMMLNESWQLIFHLDAPFRAEDRLYFCGEPNVVRVYDAVERVYLFEGLLEVSPCK